VEKREGLPKAERIRKRRDYLQLQQRGAKVSTDVLLALALKSDQKMTRVGLTVSTKVGNAVVRNKVRRRLREIFRKGKDALPKGIDVVVIAKPKAATADYATLARAYAGVAEGLRRRFPGAAAP
jgi:ribonuclease P protein component